MARKIKTKNEWKPEGGISTGGKVEMADIDVGNLSGKASGKLEPAFENGKKKKKIHVPRAPRKKGDVTEEAFQYYRDKEASGDTKYKEALDSLIKSNPEYKEDLKLKKIRKKR